MNLIVSSLMNHPQILTDAEVTVTPTGPGIATLTKAAAGAEEGAESRGTRENMIVMIEQINC